MKKKAAAVACGSNSTFNGPIFPSKESTEKTLFPIKKDCFNNWQSLPFFAQIQREKKENDAEMGRKYNLNFDQEKTEDIFKPCSEADTEISCGARSDITWQPIPKKHGVVWNSVEHNELEKMMECDQERLSSKPRTNEYKADKINKDQSLFGGANRLTQNTRDTNLGMSNVYDHAPITDRNDKN